MAPRGRTKKLQPGTSRMDGAIQHLKPLGFSKDLIMKTVNSLLKVYEGDNGNEGWFFLEEASYKLVIDTLLEQQEQQKQQEQQEQQEPDSTEMNSNPTEEAQHDAEASASGTAHEFGGIEPMQTENDMIQQPEHVTREQLSRTGSDHPIPSAKNHDSLPTPFSFDVVVDPASPNDNNVKGKRVGSQSGISRVTARDRPIQRGRKPCYGWISDTSDDEEVEFLQRDYMEIEKTANIETSLKKRKSRWDVRPDDM